MSYSYMYTLYMYTLYMYTYLCKLCNSYLLHSKDVKHLSIAKYIYIRNISYLLVWDKAVKNQKNGCPFVCQGCLYVCLTLEIC